MKRLATIFLLVALAIPAFAGDEVVLSNGEWAPYLSETLPHYGAASHIVTEAFAAAGVTTRYEFYPWKRAYKMALEGQVSGTPVWVYTKERARDFLYTDVVVTDYEYLFHLKSRPLDWQQVDDLKGMIIGATLHTVYPALDHAVARGILQIERGGNYDNLYNRLLNHRIDAIPQVSQVGKYYLRTTLSPEQREKVTYSPTVLQERQYHLILSKHHKDSKRFLKLFNQGLARIKENGTYHRIMTALDTGVYDKP